MGLSSETSSVPPDRAGDLPLWTVRGVGNSLYSFPRGQGEFSILASNPILTGQRFFMDPANLSSITHGAFQLTL